MGSIKKLIQQKVDGIYVNSLEIGNNVEEVRTFMPQNFANLPI